MKCLLFYAFINFLLVVHVSGEYSSWRLPNTTTPIDYNISVTLTSRNPYQIVEVFSGIVEIKVKIIEETEDIYLHSKFANISEVVLSSINNQRISVEFKIIPDRELLHIKALNGNLIANSEYIIKIIYISELRRDKLGFHLSSYINASSQKMYVLCFCFLLESNILYSRDIASTQFAPTEARHAFPCFDEPRLKARFTVSVQHPKEYHVLGNMEVDRKDEL